MTTGKEGIETTQPAIARDQPGRQKASQSKGQLRQRQGDSRRSAMPIDRRQEAGSSVASQRQTQTARHTTDPPGPCLGRTFLMLNSRKPGSASTRCKSLADRPMEVDGQLANQARPGGGGGDCSTGRRPSRTEGDAAARNGRGIRAGGPARRRSLLGLLARDRVGGGETRRRPACSASVRSRDRGPGAAEAGREVGARSARPLG